MKDHQIKLKDKDGKDVIGDFKNFKEGKVDLTGLKAGKYSAKIKIGSDKTLLSKVKSINIDDVMSIINHIGKVKFLSDKEIVAGNTTRPETNDDKVDIDDVMSILKIIGGLKKALDQLEVREANQTNSSSEYIDVSSGEVTCFRMFSAR